jgi:Fur family transcriptional regulator, stress-responsive regulator
MGLSAAMLHALLAGRMTGKERLAGAFRRPGHNGLREAGKHYLAGGAVRGRAGRAGVPSWARQGSFSRAPPACRAGEGGVARANPAIRLDTRFVDEAEVSELAAKLRAAGLRVTAPRVAVLAALPDGRHCSVDQISALARRRLGGLSTQAVYDILEVLVKTRFVRRIEPAGGPARFETRVGDNHHHAVCRSCGEIWDVDCAVGQAPCLEPGDGLTAAGFETDEAEVTFWGICARCASPAG